MTESEWLASDDPQTMLRYLTTVYPSDRKLRLFACACVRQVWHLLTDERSRSAVEVAERFADGEASAEELTAARAAAWDATRAAAWGAAWDAARDAARDAAWTAARDAAWGAAWDAAWGAAWTAARDAAWTAARDAARAAAWTAAQNRQAHLLRCICGNPWRPVTYPCCEGVRRVERVTGDATNLTGGVCPEHGVTHHLRGTGWLTPTVLSLAQAAYEERLADGILDPLRLAVLADALEEAGCVGEECANCKGKRGWWQCPSCRGAWRGKVGPDCFVCGHPKLRRIDCHSCSGAGRLPHPILAHLRSPGPHVRGCWAVDLILGKE